MFKISSKILKYSNEKCRFSDPKCKAFDRGGFLKCTCGKTPKAPSAPAFQLPGFAQGLPEEQLALIRAQVGKQVAIPQEFEIASETLQGLLGTQPDQFQFPLEAIQEALDAPQAQQLQRFEEKVNTLLAQI